MKYSFRFLFLIFLLLLTGSATGQQPRGSHPDIPQSRFYPDASAWLVGDLGTLDQANLAASATKAIPELAARHFGATGRERFVQIRSAKDSTGRFHARFQQYLRGLEVVGAQLNVHVDQASGKVLGMNGRFAPDLGLSPEPSLNAQEALESAMAEAGILDGQLLSLPKLTYLLPPEDDQIHLAWSAVVLYSNLDGPLTDHLFADANDGALLTTMPQQAFAKNRKVYDANHQNYCYNLPTNTLLITEGGTSNDPVAQAAYDNAGRVYDFHSAVFGRDSLDGNGETIKMYVHHGTSSNNAQFCSQERLVWFGDGDGVTSGPLGNALDVVAHELQHGITYVEAGSSSPGEPIALHEAISDMFAAAAEAWVDGSTNNNTFKIGEDVHTPGLGGDAIRYMYDPARDGVSKDFYPEFSSAAFPHENAGILNLAFYLLSQGGTHPRGKTNIPVTGIGLIKARQLIYDAYNYLFTSAKFKDFRFAVIQSAADRYGTSSTEYSSAKAAFCAVGFDCSDVEPPRMYIDRPGSNQQVSGNYLIQGWATDASGVKQVSVKLDGQPVTISDLTYGTYRQDVCNAHSDLNDPNCPYVGWQGTLNTNAYNNGSHILTVTATDTIAQSTYINRTFKIVNTQTQTFNATADAWVNQLSPNTNYGATTDLRVRSAATGSGHHTYLKFTVTGVTGTVQSAILRIRTQSTSFPSSRVYYMSSNSWSEGSITWNNASQSFILQYPIGSLPGNAWVLIDVSSIVKSSGTFTIGLVAADVPNLAFYSRESSYKPTLEVTWVP